MIVTTNGWLSSTCEMKGTGEANYVLGVEFGFSQEIYIKKV